jgi:hypothetical protein
MRTAQQISVGDLVSYDSIALRITGRVLEVKRIGACVYARVQDVSAINRHEGAPAAVAYTGVALLPVAAIAKATESQQ